VNRIHPPSVLMILLVLAAQFLVQFQNSAARGQDRTSGRKVDEILDRPLGGIWAGIPRRNILERLATAARLSVLIDRRIDSSIELTLEAKGEPLRETFVQASPEGTQLSVVSDIVYLGPAEPAGKLRTAIALREEDLKAADAPKSRQTVLLKRRDIAWQDLDSPRQILDLIGQTWNLQLEGVEQVPHDLWPSADLPSVTAAEALSLVLVQFDLTFAWTAQGAGVRVIPLPDKVVVTRPHPAAKGLTAKASAAQWMEDSPGLEVKVEGPRVLVTGTLEQHDAITTPRRTKETTAQKPLPLSRVRFTLKWDNVLRGIFETMHNAPNTQLVFEYDEAELKRAGIDLDQRIKFEVTNATVSQVLKAAFDPVGIQFTMQDRNVKLSPKSAEPPQP